jgi:hypothetical protein
MKYEMSFSFSTEKENWTEYQEVELFWYENWTEIADAMIEKRLKHFKRLGYMDIRGHVLEINKR